MLLSFLISLFLFLSLPSSASAQGANYCWCSGPDAQGNQCVTTGPSCTDSVPYEGFDICCGNPSLYTSAFALKSPICGTSTEIIPTCAEGFDASGNLVNRFCFGNEFRTGTTSPDFDGVDNAVITVTNGPFQYNGQGVDPGQSYYVCNSIASCCANPDVVDCRGAQVCDNPADPSSCHDINDNPGTPPPSDNPPPPIPFCAVASGGTEDGCTYDGNLSRPNGTCKERVPFVHSQLEDYQLTCAVTPQAQLERYTCAEEAASDAPPGNGGPPPSTYRDNTGWYCTPSGPDDPNCKEFIDIRLLVNFNGLQLGGLGPDLAAESSITPDKLARVYPYSGLADKPLFVTDGTPKESFRTFWRLLTQEQQMNAKAWMFHRYKVGSGLTGDISNLLHRALEIFNRLSPVDIETKRTFTEPIFDSPFPFVDPADIPEPGTTPSVTPTPTDSNNPPLPSNTGTNIGYGHTADFFGTAAANKPVTFLLAINSDDGTLQRYNQLYSQATVRLIRITGLQPNTEIGYLTQLKDFATRLSAVFTRNTDIVIFGNELNDLREYNCSDLAQCGTTYKEQLLFFKSGLSGLKIAAAPMNTSHPERDAGIFLATAKEAYQAADYTAHNVYSLSSCAFASIRCGTESWLWEQQITGTTGKPHVFTEYGLEPKTGDLDLNAVLAFITSGPSHPLAITPLIRNACPTATGEWLIYDGVNILDSTGAIVNPDCSVTSTDESLIPPVVSTFTISELINSLPKCLTKFPVCNSAAERYAKLNPETRAMYDAFQPFVFDNVRGYLALRYVDPTTFATTVGILNENLPYIQALRDIIGDPVGGILNTISPSWLLAEREKKLYTADNYSITYKQDGTLDFNTESDQVFVPLADRTVDIWAYDNLCRDLDDEKNMSLSSPPTFPLKLPTRKYDKLPGDEFPDVLDQSLLVPVKTEEIKEDQSCPVKNPLTGAVLYYTSGYKTTMQAESVGEASSGLLFRNFGRTIAVFNNPKITDLNRLISEPLEDGTNLSLYSQMLPSKLSVDPEYPSRLIPGATYEPMDQPDTPYMLGQASAYFSAEITGDEYLKHRATAGITDKSTAPVRRLGGRAESDLCRLRNFWLIPTGLQTGKSEDCEDLGSFVSASYIPPDFSIPPEASDSATNTSLAFCDGVPEPSGHNVKPVDALITALGGTVWNPKAPNAITSEENIRRCYNYVISIAKVKGMDPAMTMATWIEESGASNYAKFNPVDDLGCGGGINNNLTAQLECFTSLQYAYSTQSNHLDCRALDSPTDRASILEFFQIFACGDAACRREPPQYDFSCTYTDSQPGTFNWPAQINAAYKATQVNNEGLDYSKILPSIDWSN